MRKEVPNPAQDSKPWVPGGWPEGLIKIEPLTKSLEEGREEIVQKMT